MKLYLARPRGFCAGVERAIRIVELALDIYGPPVWVRKEIVHNRHVVDSLKPRGARFVNEIDEVPEGAVTIYSAHGVSPAVRALARERRLRVIDATCPLVAKVHVEVQNFARRRHRIILIGHAGHEEVEGTMGEAPEDTILVQSAEDVARLEIPPDAPIAAVTQTTLSIDDTRDVMEAIQTKFPGVRMPPRDDICYATQNRQHAIKEMAPLVDVVLILGAANSSNSLRLREVAEAMGKRAFLIPDKGHLDAAWLAGCERVGVSAGASAPEYLVEDLVKHLMSLGYDDLVELRTADEDVVFSLPEEVVRPDRATA